MIDLPVIDAASAKADDKKYKFWRSAADLEQDASMLHLARPEFMPGVDEPPGGASRRQFIQLMGASMALAGLSSCRRPVENILPYSDRPEEVIPGIAMYYATAMPFRGILKSLLVESNDGRPTKVEGNPDHPVTMGASGIFEQASILNLYDPDRSKAVLNNQSASDWNAFVDYCRGLLRGADSRQIAVLCEPTSSPTVQALRGQMSQAFPQLKWITYAPEGNDPGLSGMQLAYGRSLRPWYHFDEADVIVSFDADFLSPLDRNFVHNARSFAAGRKLTSPSDSMSRLYAVESAFTVTGASADNRLRLRSSEIADFVAAVAVHLQVEGVSGVGAQFVDHPYAREIANDLRRAGSSGVVVAGDTQSPEVHAMCAAINQSLNAVGNTVTLFDTGEPAPAAQSEELRGLVSDMRNGSIDALIMIGVNPVYDLPGELDFSTALPLVETSVHLGSHLDETGVLSTWHIPRSHYLEAWGDGRAYDGTLSVIQPLIAPLFDSKSEIEVLQALGAGLDVSGYDLVRARWQDVVTGDFEAGWNKILHDGFLADSQFDSVLPVINYTASSSPLSIGENDIEVVFQLDSKVLDGSFSNNAWCQELPDPVTKVVWDNVAVMSPKTAETLGVEVKYKEGKHYSDIISLTVNNNTVELPVWIVPGTADNSIRVTLGYGRELPTERTLRGKNYFDLDHYTDVYNKGAVSNGIGVNVASLRTPTTMKVAIGANVTSTSRNMVVVTTQDHQYMEGRPLYRMATMEEYRAHPEFAAEAVKTLPGGEPWGEYPTLWEEDHPTNQPAFKDNPYYENQWAMVIDLNACTGCSACMIACQSENNVQVVGKEEVGRGRELHWIRLDRYYVSEEGNEDNPMMVSQPIPCMHCENAPCESVCPVAATVHSPDGTNQMIYNRCIGTRYCANNCPYKVRRFNFFNWSKTLPVEVQMTQNPNVTVRSRGVMEKCSFCIQRIRRANIKANVENTTLKDGDVVTACQQACPTGAIVFGDINNPASKVVEYRNNDRRYEMLAELNTKPRTSYLGRVRNPNPELEGVTV